MIQLNSDKFHALYEIRDWSPFNPPIKYSETDIRFFIGSTAESRAICNDPFVLGVDYTNRLKVACAYLFSALKQEVSYFPQKEAEATVVNILRGGLNFGLRESLARAFDWNCHSSAFISAQRARRSENPDDWLITETSYRKVFLPASTSLFIADVVATGVSLKYALGELFRLVEENNSQIRSLVFVTIGGIRAAEHVVRLHQLCKQKLKNYEGAIVLFLEGCFAVAGPKTPLQVKITDTDLIRRDGIIAPEFLASQYGNPAYPLERCTIYDAGSRAFWVPEYLEDVIDYWNQTLQLAKNGVDFATLVGERMPELTASRFRQPSLEEICLEQLQKAHQLLSAFHHGEKVSPTAAEKRLGNFS